MSNVQTPNFVLSTVQLSNDQAFNRQALKLQLLKSQTLKLNTLRRSHVQTVNISNVQALNCQEVARQAAHVHTLKLRTQEQLDKWKMKTLKPMQTNETIKNETHDSNKTASRSQTWIYGDGQLLNSL